MLRKAKKTLGKRIQEIYDSKEDPNYMEIS